MSSKLAAIRERIRAKEAADKKVIQARIDESEKRDKEKETEERTRRRAEQLLRMQERAAAQAREDEQRIAKRIALAPVPKCKCGVEAVRAVVNKEGPHRGRTFWACKKPKDEGRCNFFDWLLAEAELPDAVSVATGVGEVEQPKCNCGLEPKRLTQKKDGPNLGRAFLVCPEQIQEKRCKYFKWADEVPTSSAAQSSAASKEPPKCQCGLPSMRLVQKKEGPNIGRAFFKCSQQIQEKRCKFFEWEAVAVPTASERSSESSGGIQQDQPKCQCGLVAVRLVQKKEGPNLGRAFLKCPEQIQEKRCRFFQWVDETPADAKQAAAISTRGLVQ